MPNRFGKLVIARCPNGIGTGPLIGVQSGPLVARSATPLVQPAKRVGVAQPADQGSRMSCAQAALHARFLKRQLSLPVSTISQWWVSRSSSAVVILASPANTLGHSPNARLVVTTIEVVS